jgi:transposase
MMVRVAPVEGGPPRRTWVDRRGQPRSVHITAGQCGDNPQSLPVLDQIMVPGCGAEARVRSRLQRVLADTAYSHPWTRNVLRKRGIVAVIPEKSGRIARRKAMGRAGGRPPNFDAEAYKEPNVAEPALNRLKQWPTQAVARSCHPLRQARPQLPSRDRRRRAS